MAILHSQDICLTTRVQRKTTRLSAIVISLLSLTVHHFTKSSIFKMCICYYSNKDACFKAAPSRIFCGIFWAKLATNGTCQLTVWNITCVCSNLWACSVGSVSSKCSNSCACSVGSVSCVCSVGWVSSVGCVCVSLDVVPWFTCYFQYQWLHDNKVWTHSLKI